MALQIKPLTLTPNLLREGLAVKSEKERVWQETG